MDFPERELEKYVVTMKRTVCSKSYIAASPNKKKLNTQLKFMANWEADVIITHRLFSY